MISSWQWSVNIRKFVLTAHSLDELVSLGSLTQHAAPFLEAAVAAGLNIIVAGGTQAGNATSPLDTYWAGSRSRCMMYPWPSTGLVTDDRTRGSRV